MTTHFVTTTRPDPVHLDVVAGAQLAAGIVVRGADRRAVDLSGRQLVATVTRSADGPAAAVLDVDTRSADLGVVVVHLDRTDELVGAYRWQLTDDQGDEVAGGWLTVTGAGDRR